MVRKTCETFLYVKLASEEKQEVSGLLKQGMQFLDAFFYSAVKKEDLNEESLRLIDELISA